MVITYLSVGSNFCITWHNRALAVHKTSSFWRRCRGDFFYIKKFISIPFRLRYFCIFGYLNFSHKFPYLKMILTRGSFQEIGNHMNNSLVSQTPKPIIWNGEITWTSFTLTTPSPPWNCMVSNMAQSLPLGSPTLNC